MAKRALGSLLKQFPRFQQSNLLRHGHSSGARTLTGLAHPLIKVSEEVRDAVETSKPLVALESTIYTHGFPYPENVALASRLESVVRLHGGVPATIGVISSIAHIGLCAEQLIELTSSAGRPQTRKVSRRDLPYILGMGFGNGKIDGGTTVSATSLLASWAKIKIFATGGLGGVHRGGETSMDVSADLTELGRTQIAVVSSGCKSFLDISRTLEYLETQGVCVSTFADGREGQVDFPAFWTRDSGTRSPLTIQNEDEAAWMIAAQRNTSLGSGILLANPIPVEYSIDKREMDSIIAQALQDAEATGSRGSDNTPFVLQRIREISKGASVNANRALVEANVARGTKVAVKLENLMASMTGDRIVYPSKQLPNDQASINSPESQINPGTNKGSSSFEALNSTTGLGANATADVVVAGSIALDLSADLVPHGGANVVSKPTLQTSNPASIRQTLGGVGQNVAFALACLGMSVRLCSILGDDSAGSTALNMLKNRDLQTAGIHICTSGPRSAQYLAVNDSQKDLVLAMADMQILEDAGEDFDSVWKPQLEKCKPKWLVVDANWNPKTIRKWIDAAKALGISVAFEPVSMAKSERIFPKRTRDTINLPAVPSQLIDLATPNALELNSMHEAASLAGVFDRDDWWHIIDSMGLPSSGSRQRLTALTNAQLVDEGIPQQSIRLLPFIPCIMTTLGERGVLMTQLLRPGNGHLTSPSSAPYILSRSTDGSNIVGGVYMRIFEPAERIAREDITSVNGVGDTFLGILMAGLASKEPKPIGDLIEIAQKGSIMTLKSSEAVSPSVGTLSSQI